LTLVTNLLIVVVIVIWLALVYWTFADARRRISDRFLIACATLIAFVPFVGSFIYLIVRPPEYLDDVRERELEMAAAEARIAAATSSGPEGQSCPHCDQQIESDFIRCPSCLRRLREPCPSCEKPLEPEWRICPYCEADPKQSAPRATTTRRRRPAAAAPAAASATAKPSESDAVDAEPRPKRAARSTTRSRARSAGAGSPKSPPSDRDEGGKAEPEASN